MCQVITAARTIHANLPLTTGLFAEVAEVVRVVGVVGVAEAE